MKFCLSLTAAFLSTTAVYAHNTTPAVEQHAPANKPEAATNAHISINRFILATGIEHREPHNAKENFTTADGKVFAFADLSSKGNDHVVFQWKHEGKEHAKVQVKVSDSARWRTFSHVSALPGNWSVAIVDKSGAVLKEMNFNVSGTAVHVAAPKEAPVHQEKPKAEEPKKVAPAPQEKPKAEEPKKANPAPQEKPKVEEPKKTDPAPQEKLKTEEPKKTDPAVTPAKPAAH